MEIVGVARDRATVGFGPGVLEGMSDRRLFEVEVEIEVEVAGVGGGGGG